MASTKIKVITIITGLIIIALDFVLFSNTRIFWFLIGLAVIIALLPFLIIFITETGREKEKEEKFLEFARNLTESVRAGTPISKSIINVSGKEYGSLTEHVRKLANQVSLAIPVRQALRTFSRDINNKVVSRSVELIIEAEASGGEIGTV